MNVVKAEKFTLLKSFDGFPKSNDFKLESEEIPVLKENEILCQAVFLSVDPYMRPYTVTMKPPFTMIGTQVAKVIKSRCDKYPEGSHVVGSLGWRTLTVMNGAGDPDLTLSPLANLEDLPLSYGLGACGMPGNTAYFGLLELCQPKAGETLVVTGAAGAVGSLVGQIAKIKDCRVVGIAGTDAKCKWIKSLGFDATINYKTCADLDAALREAAPDGIDCYFDNVGGLISHKIRQQMNLFGRIAVCGSISEYNTKPGQGAQVPVPETGILFKQLKVEGFIVRRWANRWNEGIGQMKDWILEGKIKPQETIYEGFNKMPQAFIGMLKGDNTGKAVVKIC